MYKKGGSRRRAYTGREAAEARETEQRRTRRRDSIEQGRRLRYNRLHAGGDDEVEGETEGKTHDVAKLLRSGRLILGTIGLGENLVMERIENASIVCDDDDEVQYISTQPILGRSMDPMLPSDDENDIILTSEASSDSLEDMTMCLPSIVKKPYLRQRRLHLFIVLAKTCAPVKFSLLPLQQREGLGVWRRNQRLSWSWNLSKESRNQSNRLGLKRERKRR